MDEPLPRPRPRRSSGLLRRLRRAERHRASDRRLHGPGLRAATPLVFAAAGMLLATSAVNAEGTDLRAGRFAGLADVAQSRSVSLAELRDEAAALNAEIDRLTRAVDSVVVDDVRGEIATLEQLAGVAPVVGPGLRVTLTDAPADVLSSAGDDVDEALVHQQDIQAVVNAMWASGAEAVTLQGQRIVATTGIKCIGNTVRLQDVAYSPPYVIEAVGSPDVLRAGVESNPRVQGYFGAVADWQLGYEAEEVETIEAPEYTGPLEVVYARPATVAGSTEG